MSTLSEVNFKYAGYESKESGRVYEVTVFYKDLVTTIGDVRGVNGNWSYRLLDSLWKWTGGIKTRDHAARTLWEVVRHEVLIAHHQRKARAGGTQE